MTDKADKIPDHDLSDRRFYPAEQEAGFCETAPHETPQTQHPAYKLAFQDDDFLLREELRPVRFQLELLKPEMLLDEARVGSTLVMYGSARIPSPEEAEARLEAAKGDSEYEQRVAANLVAKAKYYEEAYKLARMVSEKAIVEDGKRQFVVTSGGGPSIMEAANRGASDAGAESIGLNIVLPHEQAPNTYVTPYLSFQFHYFALRKMHFLLRAKAVAVFPGGFGTFDEFFELLTLIQTGKMKPMPILLFGKGFWNRVVNFEAIAEEGTISKKDLDLITWCETADDAWAHIAEFYDLDS
ncbi:LOG family protein [Parerythrobacter jejuensis]|uniref:Cytokinin riboside 5'-monophosphate phosphoribohydrolase n=1 Tax=Parerythrobacter jejuensis TaxID=795812 RepID=A0A845AQQ3_9SPHN|nr:TIGR00730 family Rossman fold protein [Parerythrobacter jejuensis]MXP30432.1 TIGR00730 family Rossman fold protein [Parerythrobacter jejuensis]MXP33192.1 TIGR00730 family Rossman fold protein [Parerythrobacter jejuensis]